MNSQTNEDSIADPLKSSDINLSQKAKVFLPSADYAIKYFTNSNKGVSFAARTSKKKIPDYATIMQREDELGELYKLRGEKYNNGYRLYYYTELEDAQYKKIKDIIYIKNRGSHQISISDFDDILGLSDERYKMFRQMVDIKERGEDNQFYSSSVLDTVQKINPAKFNQVKQLLYIKGRKDKQFNLYEICDLSKVPEEQFKKIKKLVYLPERKDRQLDAYEILESSLNFNDHDFKNLIMLLSLKHEHTRPYDINDIKEIVSNDKVCSRYKKLLYIKERGEKQLYKYNISDFARKLSDKKFKILEKLLYINDFGDEQLSDYEIKEILKLKSEKLNTAMSLLEDKDLHISKEEFCELSKCENLNTIVSLIKQYPKIEISQIIELFENMSDEKIEFIKPVLQKSEIYNIKRDGTEISVTEKDGNNQLTMINKHKKDFMKHFIYTTQRKDGNYNYIYIVKLSKGTYISRGVSSSKDIDDIYFDAKLRPYEKLYNMPKQQNFLEMFKFFKEGDFKTKKVFEYTDEGIIGHAIFNLENSRNSVKNVNGTTISQLDEFSKNKNSDRIIYHYPNGRNVVEDWTLDISTMLEPNKTGNGMRIKKIVGNKVIDITSEIKNGNIILTNNLTGNSYTATLKDFIKRDYVIVSRKYRSIPYTRREYEITELMKQLSPTTILSLIKYKNVIPNVKFPFLDTAAESYQNKGTITLSKSPHTVSHETLHGVTDILNLAEDEELIKLHSDEAKHNRNLKKVFSRYATDGLWFDKSRGLYELISIMGTANEYGMENNDRTEMTRLAYPKTTKAIEKKLMDYYLKTISEIIDNPA